MKEIEDALLDGRVDLAVHSSKDLPAELPDGLIIGATLERDDPRDALLLPRRGRSRAFDAARARLGASPRIGTSSVRRVAQLRGAFPARDVSSRFAATSTRGCASSTPATATCSCLPPPA